VITRNAPADDPAAERRLLGLRWWKEALYVIAFYLLYSAIRNQFGSAAVSPQTALDNALRVIDVERFFGLYHEETIQQWFVVAVRGGYEFAFAGARQIMQFWNVFYGTLHFAVTAFALVWLFRRFPADYPTWRNTLAFTTAFALIGFSVFPLMPPRLLTDCGAYGACLESFGYVDSLADIGGLWSFDSGTMQSVSNQYAAMPSLHFAWSAWSFLVLYPRVRYGWARLLVVLYPLLTLWAIVVTANHFWLDAVGGALVLAAGYAVGSTLARATRRYRLANVPVPSGVTGAELHDPLEGSDGAGSAGSGR
jgi:hypothetical protein